MNVSHTYNHYEQRFEIRITIDAYDLKAATKETLVRQLRDYLQQEVRDVIQEIIRETEKPPA